MKSVKDSLLERRSIRRYTREPIAQSELDFIFDAIRNTATSYNGQQFSVVAVQDQKTKEEIYGITGQKQIKTSAIFMVFCLDYHKLNVGAKIKGIDDPMSRNTINGYTVGVIDAALAMQNAVVAAESLGLGTCCIGYVRTADPKKVSQILGLPEGVAIVCGLAIGHPNEMPDLKPKLPVEAVVHKEHYMSDDKLGEVVRKFDDEIVEFNASRSGDQTTNDWVGHILDYHRHSNESDLTGYLKSQGIDLKK